MKPTVPSHPSSRLRSVARLLLAALCVLLLVASSTSEAGKRRRGGANVVAEALALAEQDRGQAIARLETAIAQNPSAENVAELMVHAGEQHRIALNRASAKAWFDKVIARKVEGPTRDAAELGLLLLQAESGPEGAPAAPGAMDAQLLTMLAASPERNVLPTQNADRYTYLAIASAKEGDTRSLTAYAKKANGYAEHDAAVAARVTGALQAFLDAAEATSSGPSSAKLTPLQRASAALDAGNFAAAREAASEAATSATPEEQADLALLTKVIDAGPPDRNRIAVLLPLSGKYAAVGKQIREALEFGYGGAPRTLVIKDSGANAETAVAALEQAVLTDHVVAVVGPLLNEETDAVVAAAEAMRVPLLSLSASYEDTIGHRWALQGMYTRADQINALLTYVMSPERAMTAFAVFAPNSPVGLRTAAEFRRAAEARGGRIATEATYSAEEQNLLPYAKQLGVREGDIDALRRSAVQAGGKAGTVVVPPRLDFDGIFIPENATRTPLACAALAFEEFPMGDFTPTKGSKRIPLLGLSWWNTPSLVATGNEYVRNSLFTDVFSATVAGDADPFVVAYRGAYGRPPTALEAATVDAGKLLASAASSPASSRAEFLDALLAAQLTESVTGLTRINPETRRGSRQMYILTLTRSTIEQLARVPLE